MYRVSIGIKVYTFILIMYIVLLYNNKLNTNNISQVFYFIIYIHQFIIIIIVKEFRKTFEEFSAQPASTLKCLQSDNFLQFIFNRYFY